MILYPVSIIFYWITFRNFAHFSKVIQLLIYEDGI